MKNCIWEGKANKENRGSKRKTLSESRLQKLMAKKRKKKTAKMHSYTSIQI